MERVPIDFAKFYDDEMQQRDQLRSAVATPISLISLLGALLGAMSHAFHFDADLASALFTSLVGGACCFLACAVYFVVQAYHGHVYRRIPFPLAIRTYTDQLVKWHAAVGGQPAVAEAEVALWLEEEYAQAADKNAKINRDKWDYLFLANRRIIYSAILIAVASVPYLINQIAEQPEHATLIELSPDLRKAIATNARQKRSGPAGAASAAGAVTTRRPAGAGAPNTPAAGVPPRRSDPGQAHGHLDSAASAKPTVKSGRVKAKCPVAELSGER